MTEEPGIANNETEYLRVIGYFSNIWLLPVICVLGVVLNVACLLVFLSNRTHPLVPSLIVLSLCDLLQLLLSILVLFVPAYIDFFSQNNQGWMAQLAYVSTGLLSPLLLASNCASIWTITFISVERHRAITRPLSTVQSSPKVFPLVLITLIALLFNAPKWFEFNWTWIMVEANDGTQYPFLVHEPSGLKKNIFYSQTRELVLYPFLVYLIPLILLTALNFRILSRIGLQRISASHRSRIAQENRTISLLISIVLLFFLCHTGGLIIRFIDETQYGEQDWYVLFKDLVNILFNINSFANPMAHFYTGARPSLANIHSRRTSFANPDSSKSDNEKAFDTNGSSLFLTYPI